MSDSEKIDLAVEVAFNALVTEARKLGLSVPPDVGLMDLPNQDLTERWRQSGRDILEALSA